MNDRRLGAIYALETLHDVFAESPKESFTKESVMAIIDGFRADLGPKDSQPERVVVQ